MSRRPTGLPAGALLALAALAGAMVGGCSFLPFRARPEPEATPASAVASEPPAGAPEPAAADSAGAPAAVPDLVPEAVVDADSTGAPPPPAPETMDASPPPQAAEPVSATKPAPPPPDPDAIDQVKVQISDAERAELENEARESLREARRVIRSIDRTTLSEERLEKLTAAESLVEAAKAAFEDDIRAAATLAHKASVLLTELTTN